MKMKVVLIVTLISLLCWTSIVSGQMEGFTAEDVERIIGLCAKYCEPHLTKEGYTKPRRCGNIVLTGPRDICNFCRTEFRCVINGVQIISG